MKDKKGYYAILHVTENVGEKEIKDAFRREVKLYHPDKNSDPGAKAIYLKINEAYQVLTDPDARKAYDNVPDAAADFMPCCLCGRHAHQPRFILFDEGGTTLNGGVFCRPCASRRQFKTALKIWRRFLISPVESWRLLKKARALQEMPASDNFAMLMQNAAAFNSEKRYGLAKSLAEQARRFALDSPERAKINMFLNILPPSSHRYEPDYWRPRWTDILRVYLPAFIALLIALLVLTAPYLPRLLSDRDSSFLTDYEQQNVMPFAFNLSDETQLYHTTAEQTSVYQAPSIKSGVIAVLPAQTTVRLTGYVPHSPWVQAMTHQGLVVFIRRSELAKGLGAGTQPYHSKILLTND
ncbi:MAG: J domain-containing protein [Alphaproteobacteria bacterium]|nr:J domain-containing protein [Alphaproteobacteria bacterium]